MKALGPYRLRAELAVGGMAEVFLAEHHAPADVRREVVVKRVLPQFADDPDFRNMFLDEARLMAALTHPYIAQVYDVGLDRGTVYLVMEYIRGPTIRDLLAGAAERGHAGLPRAAALSIALAVAEALDYAHGRRDPEGRPLGIVHRDLNPQNVLVAYTGAVKLIDFGIAKAASRLHQTRGGIVKGTWGYIAPEQISRRAPLDHRADIFALGVLLFELCFGRHPFGEGDHETEQLGRMVNGNVIDPKSLAPDFPDAIARLLRACLRPEPADRPAQMSDVVDALAEHMRATGESVTLRELAEVAGHLVPDPHGPRAIAPPSRSTRDHLARAAALAPHERTAPSLSITYDPEDETEPTEMRRLLDQSGPPARPSKPPGSGPSKLPGSVPGSVPGKAPGSSPRHTRALVDLPTPSGPPPPQPPAPPGQPPPPLLAPPSPPPANLAAIQETTALPRIRPYGDPAPTTQPSIHGLTPPPARHGWLLTALTIVVLALTGALLALLLMR